MNHLDVKALQAAVGSGYAAICRRTRLEPLGDKVYPPTYEGGEYATEGRQVRDERGGIQTVQTVLLDSVQSQANRMEMALLRAIDSQRITLPLLQVDFAQGGDSPVLQDISRLTVLEAPHRFCDAIFRDSEFEGKPFRQSSLGIRLNDARPANATPVFELCPTALIFGFWDSMGPRGGMGAKVQRALVSEIVGYASLSGTRPTSRLDPLQIENNVDIYEASAGNWTMDESEAAVSDNGAPKKIKPSNVGHGNIRPTLRHEDKETKKFVPNHGGVTLAYAMQHTVLSLAALRRLRFPVNGKLISETEVAARTVLAALALAAICFLDLDGYDLRSRCLLDGPPGTFQFAGGGAGPEFQLNADSAAALLDHAVDLAKKQGLKWTEEPMILKPSASLTRLVIDSRTKSMAAGAGA